VTATADGFAVSQAANQAPTVALTSPSNGDTFEAPATIDLTASAADPEGRLSRVEFYNGSALLGSAASAPYTFTWSSVPAGTYALTAVAYDADGASTTSSPVSVTVAAPANKPPLVALTAPANNSTFTAPANIPLTADASDADGSVARVEFYNGATLLGSDSSAPYAFTWSSVPAGTYTLTAKAYDDSGASATSGQIAVTVTAPNQAPTVALSSPANNATYTAPATIGLAANASDADGSVARVEFYSGATLLGSDSSAPYAFTWSSVPAGTYTLTARAYDNAGAVATSAAVTVTVTAVSSAPTGVVFQASADHATVTSYRLDVFAAGADPATAAPVATYDAGKPAPDANNDITVSAPSFFSALAAGSYQLTISAINAGGIGRSTPVSFTR
jgi:major membrane immunogen (membrane-anchored lipoprotein)